MKNEMSCHRLGIFLCLILLLTITGCAGQKAFNSGLEAYREGDYDSSVAHFFQATRHEPEKDEYRMQLYAARLKAGLQHLKAARSFRDEGQQEQAVREYRQALAYDPSLQVAMNELEELQKQEAIRKQLKLAREQLERQQYDQARQTAATLQSLYPDLEEAAEIVAAADRQLNASYGRSTLDIESTKPISIEFRNTDVRQAFGILGRMSGLQFIFDTDLKPKPMKLKLEQVTAAQAMEAMMTIQQLKAKQLNRSTYLIYQATRKKEQEYEDQMIRTFFLSHITAKEGMALLRSVLKPKNIAVNEKTNALVVRGVPEMLVLADKLLQAADRGEPEVMFELELIEVNHSDSLLLGPSLSPYAISAGLAKDGTVVASSIASGGSAENLLTSSFKGVDGVFTMPTATFDFQKTLTDSEILASPKVRVKNKEKAKVHVGTREPVITTTTSGETVSESVQYVDVGVKLDIEPNIQLDNTVNTKISLEVSNVIERTTTSNGTLVLSLSTTNAETALLLKDGERTIIGGLIRDDNSRTRQVIPGLGDLPLIGNLFTNHDRENKKREILLSITPHIVRNLKLPGANLTHLLSGGENDPRAGGSFSSFDQEIASPDEMGDDDGNDVDTVNTEQSDAQGRRAPVSPRPPRQTIDGDDNDDAE